MRFLLLAFFFFLSHPRFFFLLKVLKAKQAPGEEVGGCVAGLVPSQPQIRTSTVKGPHAPRPPCPDVTQERRALVAFQSWGHRSAPLPQPSQYLQGRATPTSPRGDTAPL